MDSSLDPLFSVFLVFFLVFLNGFFVAAEFALVRSRDTKLKSPELINKYGSRSALKLMGNLDGSLSVTQLGITVASLLLGWWGEHTFQQIFVHWLSWLGGSLALATSHIVATLCALFVITYLHIVVGELAAKSLAIRFPELLIRWVALPILTFEFCCRPVIWALNGSATLLLRLFWIRTPSHSEQVHSSTELAMLIAQSTAGGALDKDEELMLQGVFEFSDTVAREVMTARTDLATIPADSSLTEVVELMAKSGFSRLPVVGETTDNVLGVVVLKDLLPYVSSQIANGGRDFSVRKVMRECYFIPGTKPIDDLLREFKRRKLHIAVVLDEHGGVDGVVTLEDLLEEIVGDIFDESDIPERDIIVRENGDVIIDGGVLVADLNSRFRVKIPEGDYDTIAGFVMTLLGRVPKQGDELRLCSDGIYFNGTLEPDSAELMKQSLPEPGDDSGGMSALMSVQKVSGHRIETLRIRFVSEEKDISESTPGGTSSQHEEALSPSVK